MSLVLVRQYPIAGMLPGADHGSLENVENTLTMLVCRVETPTSLHRCYSCENSRTGIQFGLTYLTYLTYRFECAAG
jgi:hypothetical protein